MKRNLIIEYDNIRMVFMGQAKKEMLPEINLLTKELEDKNVEGISIWKDGRVI